MAKRPHQEEFDRDILDIIPERYDADEDSYEAQSGSRTRSIITIVVALVAVAGIVAAGWRFMSSRHLPGAGSQVIKADDRAIKVRPDDRGGMQVPNQDKLVYGRMENDSSDAAPKTERLLAPPEEPKPPPRPGDVPPQPAPALTSAPAPAPPPAPIAVAPPPEPPPIAAPQPVHTQPVPADAPPPKADIEMPKPKAVVAAPPPPAALAPAVHKPAVETSGDYLVQLGAVRSADAADKEWARIKNANSDLLSGLKSDIVQVDIPNKGTFWRIRAGSLSEQSGRQLCQQLTGRNQGCILVRK